MKHECTGCSEYKALSRRQFMQRTSVAALTAALGPAWLPRVAYAQDATTDRDIIVSIYLRGGCDGLSLCVPHGEDAYYTARPTINVPRPDSGDPNAALDLDGFFGFPPAFQPLLEAFDAGNLLVVHATGSMDETRSHFDAQHFMEVGKPRDPSLITGWLGRHVMTAPPLRDDAFLRALGISNALQRTLVGAPLALATPRPDDFALFGAAEAHPLRLMSLDEMYMATDEPIRTSATNTQRTLELLDAIDFDNYTPYGGAVYPQNDFGRSIRSAAALIKADAGVEALAVDIGGWDTHENQGTLFGGLSQIMSGLGGALGAFHTDVIGEGNHNVTVVVMSEFGRNVRQNASNGTDHGHGNMMLAMGTHINGGQVLADWPGLEPEQLYEGQDLDVTIDYRDILAEIVQNRLGNMALDQVFPEFTPTFRNITTA